MKTKMYPTEDNLKSAIKEAIRKAVNKLFNEINEQFYYLVLITTGEAHAPFMSAWTEEALLRCENYKLKWSYADSPYCFYGEEFFKPVQELFGKRPHMSYKMSETEWINEFNFRINSMESALKELDEENIFERASKRKQMIINVEVVPPDYTNTLRALRLNSESILKEWLNEYAEYE